MWKLYYVKLYRMLLLPHPVHVFDHAFSAPARALKAFNVGQASVVAALLFLLFIVGSKAFSKSCYHVTQILQDKLTNMLIP